MRCLAFLTCALFVWLSPSSVTTQRIVAETLMIPAADPGIQLHVRNKRLVQCPVNSGPTYRWRG